MDPLAVWSAGANVSIWRAGLEDQPPYAPRSKDMLSEQSIEAGRMPVSIWLAAGRCQVRQTGEVIGHDHFA
jgi:hypothetical protein